MSLTLTTLTIKGDSLYQKLRGERIRCSSRTEAKHFYLALTSTPSKANYYLQKSHTSALTKQKVSLTYFASVLGLHRKERKVKMTKVEIAALIFGAILLCLARVALDDGAEGWKIALIAISGLVISTITLCLSARRSGWKW